MAKLNASDFYFGSVIISLFNRGIKPAIIENEKGRQVYDFMTNNQKFRWFIKYRSNPTLTEQDDYLSWQFVLSQNDLAELKKFLDDQLQLCLVLVCGNEILHKSEFAILHPDEITKILEQGKSSISISRKTHEHKYRIAMAGSRKLALRIDSNRYF